MPLSAITPPPVGPARRREPTGGPRAGLSVVEQHWSERLASKRRRSVGEGWLWAVPAVATGIGMLLQLGLAMLLLYVPGTVLVLGISLHLTAQRVRKRRRLRSKAFDQRVIVR
jgi:hypothetical protein